MREKKVPTHLDSDPLGGSHIMLYYCCTTAVATVNQSTVEGT